jgi:4-hydroxy-tetrahydrodipicolinate reductase
MTPLRLAIAGCTGKMGRTLVRLASRDPAFEIVAAVTEADDPALGQDVGSLAGVDGLQIRVRDSCEAACDALIEFSSPAGCRVWANWCAEHAVPLVSGTTGLEQADRAALEAAANRVPVVWSPNMSVGINLLLRLVTELAEALDESWDVEICEAHHRQKADAPSGTARALFEAVCRARGKDPQAFGVLGRSDAGGPRQPGEIGVHALRLGDSVGEHEVHFAAAGEVLTLRHRALSRDIFAAGALRAARWLVGRPPGLYHMRDVLSA